MDKEIAKNILEKANYITVDSDKLCFVHDTLREISNIYPISHTTISKALKDKTVASCKIKNGNYLIIRKLYSISEED
tara:strand:- start:3572 stop:3802 length:231 start_codon:yes stop_codon:yes gene_type:complete